MKPLPERGAWRASPLGVMGELVEERRLEVRGGPRRPDTHQCLCGFVARPIRQLPGHTDREPTQAIRAGGDRVGESLPFTRSHRAEVLRCLVGEAQSRPGGRRGECHERHHGADQDRAYEDHSAHDPNATLGGVGAD